MRNLKRALSMALAAVMLLGMMVIGASAAGYSDLTDTDEIVNKEAVALLVDLGVIDGKSSGRYDPTGTLERVEFTKLVFGMMMGQNSDATVYEDAGIFSDVDTCWGEGFINYCASIGMPVAALTDRPDSPVARCAQTTLLCHVELMGMTNSFTSMVGLVDTLAMLYTFTSGAPTQEEKTCRDTLHRKFDSCFSDPNTSI